MLPWEAAWIANDGASTFTVTIPPDKTATLAPGGYTWIARASKAGEVFNIARGVLTVLADVAEATATELQSHPEKALALIKAAIEGRLPSGMESATIGGRTISKIPLTDLVALCNKYGMLVAMERNGGRLPARTVTFSRGGA